MTRTRALVPAKAAANGRGRFADLLTDEQRRRLAAAMCGDASARTQEAAARELNLLGLTLGIDGPQDLALLRKLSGDRASYGFLHHLSDPRCAL